MEGKHSPTTERWLFLFIIAEGQEYGFEGQEEELLLGQWLDKKKPGSRARL